MLLTGCIPQHSQHRPVHTLCSISRFPEARTRVLQALRRRWLRTSCEWVGIIDNPHLHIDLPSKSDKSVDLRNRKGILSAREGRKATGLPESAGLPDSALVAIFSAAICPREGDHALDSAFRRNRVDTLATGSGRRMYRGAHGGGYVWNGIPFYRARSSGSARNISANPSGVSADRLPQLLEYGR
jgi:hypothetical protein